MSASGSVRVPGRKRSRERWNSQRRLARDFELCLGQNELAALACGHCELTRSAERARNDVIRCQLFVGFVAPEAGHMYMPNLALVDCITRCARRRTLRIAVQSLRVSFSEVIMIWCRWLLLAPAPRHPSIYNRAESGSPLSRAFPNRLPLPDPYPDYLRQTALPWVAIALWASIPEQRTGRSGAAATSGWPTNRE